MSPKTSIVNANFLILTIQLMANATTVDKSRRQKLPRLAIKTARQMLGLQPLRKMGWLALPTARSSQREIHTPERSHDTSGLQ